MIPAGLVSIKREGRRWLPVISKAGAIIVGPDGEKLIVLDDGTVDRVVQGGVPRGGVAELSITRRAP